MIILCGESEIFLPRLVNVNLVISHVNPFVIINAYQQEYVVYVDMHLGSIWPRLWQEQLDDSL